MITGSSPHLDNLIFKIFACRHGDSFGAAFLSQPKSIPPKGLAVNQKHLSPVNAIVFSLCMLMIAALMLTSLARQRAAARSIQCSNNLKQIGLAIHNYHSAYRRLPYTCQGTDGDDDATSNRGRMGFLVGLTPFIEQQQLWEQIANPYQSPSGKTFPAMGPAPWYDAKEYLPWGKGPAVYRCPDRPTASVADQPKVVFTLESSPDNAIGTQTNYVACFGDGTHMIGRRLADQNKDPELYRNQLQHSRCSQRGFFVPGQGMRFRDILDGLSNTIMVSETQSSVKGKKGLSGIATNINGLSNNPSLCTNVLQAPDMKWWSRGRGSRWNDGAMWITGFQTVLPPNSPSCASEKGIEDSVVAASSYHDGGVHVLMGDGSVTFITNSIDVGDSTSPGVHLEGVGTTAPGSESPFGLWGALGTRASKEAIEQELDALERPIWDSEDYRRKKNSSKHDFRGWTDHIGKITLSARFLKIIDKKTIELEDHLGVIHRVPLNTLSDRDIFLAVQLALKIAPTTNEGGRGSALEILDVRAYERAMSREQGRHDAGSIDQ